MQRIPPNEGAGFPRAVLLLGRGGEQNGSQRQLEYLVHGLDRNRYRPIVVLASDGPSVEDLRKGGAEVHILPMRPWRGFPRCVCRVWDAARILRLARHRDVMLVHAADPWKSGYMHHIARRLGIPCVQHVRGPMSPRDMAKHGLHRASAVIVIARRYVDDLLAAGVPESRICLIDDAVDLDLFRSSGAQPNILRQRYGVGDAVLVGLVGRIVQSKRVLEFLDVIAPLAHDERARFFIIGQPTHRRYLSAVRKAMDRLGLAEHVVLTGRCENMPQVMASLDILVSLSGGSVMFEAMACDRAVLSVRTDARHSLHTRHGETAWCVTTDRPEPATEALAHLIADGALRQRLGRAARARAEQYLSWKILATRTQALYDRLLED